MSTTAHGAPVVRPGRRLRRAGIAMLVLGFAWFAWGGLVAWFSADYGSQPSGSLQQQIAQVGPEDPQGDPDLWVGMDEQGTVIWQGTREEFEALMASGRKDLQEGLRTRYLYPGIAAMAVGAGIAVASVVVARRR
ncbi:hypothetical protein QQX10_00330 [Demequina sp. SYSU T00039]|uniref:Uncharacterized protein n=1 Tax=Demequina lignilytica TaxID=3051663 RepID=A0AAW7M7K8_9MICO|nr:hypothetical protein [Demequina sp. SYSU T00039]MDN4486607.1 hypothetical protein [Demequina sp. SYSU T00039]